MLRLGQREVVLHRCRDLHLQLLVHIATQLVAEEKHHEASRPQQQSDEEEVEEPAHYL